MREKVCMTCSSIKLEYDNLQQYLKIRGFLQNNYEIFCRCNKQGLSKYEAKELETEYWKSNYKIKK